MTPTALHRLADRVERNVPRYGNPEAFHCEKSEIAYELRKLANIPIIDNSQTSSGDGTGQP